MIIKLLSLVLHPVALVAVAVGAVKKLKVPQTVWKQVSKDINAAGASIILQSTLFSISVLCFIQGRSERKRVRRIKAVDLAREITWNPDNDKSDPAKFLRQVMGENFPQWCSFSDWDKAPFMQALLTTMWPGINNELSNLLRKILEENASNILTINKLDLGKTPMTVYGVKVLPVQNKRDTTKIDSLVVLLDLRWGGEPDVSITVKVPNTGGVIALTAGMKNLEFAGTFRLAIDGIQNQAPFLSSWNLSVMNCPPPQINYNLFVLKHLLPGRGLDVKGSIEMIVPALDKEIKKAIFADITWPKTISLPVPNGDDNKHGNLAKPLGVLEVEVTEGDLIKRFGLFGRERQLNPRILVMLPCCDNVDSSPARFAATQGGFTDAHISTTTPEWDSTTNNTFKFVITSEDQILRIVLSHKHNVKNQLEPMCYEKPLGIQNLPIKELISQDYISEDSGYYTAGEGDSQCHMRDVGVQTEDLRTLSPIMSHSWSTSRNLYDGWSARDICLQSTDKRSLASLLEDVLPSSQAYDADDGADQEGSMAWLQSKMAAMGQQAQVLGDMDWNPMLLDELAGKVTIKYRWTPMQSVADTANKQSASSASLDSNGKTSNASSSNLAKACNEVRDAKTLANSVDATTEVELVQRCLACGGGTGECTGAGAVPPLPPTASPSLEKTIKGVVGIFVERSKLHYDKLPRVPTLSARIKRIVNLQDITSRSGASSCSVPERPQALPSQNSVRKNKGSLIWDQTFYLPVETTQREIDENAVRIYVELGDVGGGLLSSEQRRQANCGKEVFVLDTYDTFDKDVKIVACSDIPLARVLKSKSCVLSDKQILAPPENTVGAGNGTVAVTSVDKASRHASNIGSLKMRIAWFPLTAEETES